MVLLWFSGCTQENSEASFSESDHTIYHGGDIITMATDQPVYVESLVERDGKIIFTGSRQEAMAKYGEGSTVVDLAGKTMLPGFIDGHAHFFGFGAQAVGANLLASPDGEVNGIDDLLEELSRWHQENGTSKTQGWIFGMGYDDAVLKENRHPTREDLDRVTGEIPLMVIHISGHFCGVN